MSNKGNKNNQPNQPNNILSYFIKDIKDAKEREFYTQVNYINCIQIFYKDKILYRIEIFITNYINNIRKARYFNRKENYKICHSFCSNYKNLYYKNDNRILFDNLNSITFNFIYNKYLKKINFKYISDSKYLLHIYIIYFNGYKYIINYNINLMYRIHKFNSQYILIPNKYELQYYCKFFNIYFVIN